MPPARTTRTLLVAGLACLILLPGLFLLLFKMRPAAAASLARTISLWLPDPVARLVLTASPLPVLERLGEAPAPGAADAASPAGELPEDAFAASSDGEASGDEAAAAESAPASAASGALAPAAADGAGKGADPGPGAAAEWPRMTANGHASAGGGAGAPPPGAGADIERAAGAGPRGPETDLPAGDVPLEPMHWTKDLGLTKEVQAALREAGDGVGSGRTRELLRQAYAEMDRQTDAAMSAALRRPLPPPPRPLRLGTLWPLEKGRITQEFGPTDFYLEPARSFRGTRYAHFHSGIDIAAPKGTAIRAYDGGQVQSVGPLGGCGMSVIIVHPNQVASTYCHMDTGARAPTVRPGQWVDSGQPIGYVGMTGITTGPHVHFITKKGEVFNPRTVLPKSK